VQYASRYTCIKPSGTVSQLVNSSSGIHPPFAKYYKRGIRADKNNENVRILIKCGIPYEEEYNGDGYILYFPVEKENFFKPSLHKFLSIYNKFLNQYTDNNISCTIPVSREDRDEIGEWLSNGKRSLISATFLPKITTFYAQMPYQEIDEKEYKRMTSLVHKDAWQSNNNRLQEFSCSSGQCELV
jgi:ribonucleoside-diphosphate reductase alpha chain